jgi:hypothetical protein
MGNKRVDKWPRNSVNRRVLKPRNLFNHGPRAKWGRVASVVHRKRFLSGGWRDKYACACVVKELGSMRKERQRLSSKNDREDVRKRELA